VDYPESVIVYEVGGNLTNVFELKVTKADVGKVIGREGRTAGALRTNLIAVSTKLIKEFKYVRFVIKNKAIDKIALFFNEYKNGDLRLLTQTDNLILLFITWGKENCSSFQNQKEEK